MTTPPPNFGPPSGGYAQAPVPKPKRWPWVLGIIGALFVGMSIGSASGGSSSSTSAPPTTTRSTPTAVAAPAAAAPAPAQQDLSQGIGQGEWSVPDQVAPGQYRSSGATPGIFELCSATVRDSRGNVLDWKTGNAGEQVLITVPAKGAASFSNAGCEPFVKR